MPIKPNLWIAPLLTFAVGCCDDPTPQCTPSDAQACCDGGSCGANVDLDTRKRVFITATEYLGNLGGETPDEMCATTARSAGFGGTWKAWASTQTENAIDRITGDGPWYLIDGRKAFENKANLMTTPLVEIDITPAGERVPTETAVWTGTLTGGTSSMKTCNNWTTVATGTGSNGLVRALTNPSPATWTENRVGTVGQSHDCNGQLRMYCFQM